jgi:hypothetical protein
VQRPCRQAGADPAPVAEAVDTIAPHQIQLGRAVSPGRAVRLLAADTG